MNARMFLNYSQLFIIIHSFTFIPFLHIHLVNIYRMSTMLKIKCVRLDRTCCAHSVVTPWTVAHQASLSMGFSRQEYWSGFAMPSSRGSSQPRDPIQVSLIAGCSLRSEPAVKLAPWWLRQ